MKKTFIVLICIMILSAKAISQDSLFTADFSATPRAYFTTIVKKDTSWVSERRTQSSGGVDRSGIFQTMPGFRIINVEFRCTDAPSPLGGACPWNYNPSGGYSKNVIINDCGKSARWSRRYDGAACTQNYTITFKKVEIEDFWKDKLKFITDGTYKPDSKVYLKNTASLPITVRYRVEYSIGGVLHSSDCNIISVSAYSNQYVGAKYINNSDGSFIINYEILEAPFQ
jgi:hypothetical protein